MIFQDVYITDAGMNLLARAASGRQPIMWLDAKTTQRNMESESVNDMRAITTATFGTESSSGMVTSSVVDESIHTATLHCDLTNDIVIGAAVPAYGFGVWAKIEGDLSETLVIIARCGGSVPTYINPRSEGLLRFFISVGINVSDNQATIVTVDASAYAQASALAVTNTTIENMNPYVYGFDNWVQAQANFVEGREFFVKGSQTRFKFRVPQSVTINNSTVSIIYQPYRIMDIYKNYVLVRVGLNNGDDCIAIVYDLKTATVTGDLITFASPVVANYMARNTTQTYKPFCSLIEISGVIGVYGSYDPDDITLSYSYWGDQYSADYTSAFMPLFSEGGMTAGRWYGTSNSKAARAIGGDSGLAFLEDTANELETFLCRLSISGNDLVYTPISLNTPTQYVHQLWCEFKSYMNLYLGRVEFSRLNDGIWCILYEMSGGTFVNLGGFYGDSTYTLNIYDVDDSNFTSFFQSRFGTNAQPPTTSAASMAFSSSENFVFHTDEGFRILSGYSFYTVRGFTELILAQKSSYSSDVSISNNGYDHLLNGEFYVTQSSNFMPNNTGFYGCVQGMLPAWNDIDPMISSDFDRRKIVFGNHFFTGDVAKVVYDSDFESNPDQISYAYIQFVPTKNMRMRDGRV